MKKSILFAFIKNIFFKKRSTGSFLTYLCFSFYILFLVYYIIYRANFLLIASLISILPMLIYSLLQVFKIDYDFYKKFEYGKDKILDKEDFLEIKKDYLNSSFDCYNYLKQLEEKIKNMENNLNPAWWTMFAFFLAIALMIVSVFIGRFLK